MLWNKIPQRAAYYIHIHDILCSDYMFLELCSNSCILLPSLRSLGFWLSLFVRMQGIPKVYVTLQQQFIS